MKKLWAIIFALVLALCTFAGCAGDNKPATPDDGGGNTEKPVTSVDYSTYGSFWMKNHNYKTMPIAAYNSSPSQKTIVNKPYSYNYLGTEQTFKDYYEAGVNTMMGLYEGDSASELEQALLWCDNYGLAYLLPCSGGYSLNEASAKARYERYFDYNAFAGVMQYDEPGYIQFEGLKKSADALTSAMQEDKSGYLWHCNLYPQGATERQYYARGDKNQPLPEDGYEWERYVQDYMRIYEPQILSYDHYPLKKNTVSDLYDSYWYQLSYIRKTAMQANIPFWVYIGACDMTHNRVPNQADVLWNVNTALSYGAKGIQYFCGVLPIEELGWSGCMFDDKGNKTAVYDYVKKANSQIKAVDEVLMCSKSKGLIQVGTLPTPDGLEEADLLASYGKLTSGSGAHSLIGCFDYNGKDAYYITNNSLTEGEALTLAFSGEVGGYYIQNAQKKTFTGSSLKLDSEAGEGVLVVLE